MEHLHQVRGFKAGKLYLLFIAEEVIVRARLPDGVVLVISCFVEQELYVLGLSCETPYAISIFSAIWLIWRRSLTDRGKTITDICTIGGAGIFDEAGGVCDGAVTWGFCGHLTEFGCGLWRENF